MRFEIKKKKRNNIAMLHLNIERDFNLFLNYKTVDGMAVQVNIY